MGSFSRQLYYELLEQFSRPIEEFFSLPSRVSGLTMGRLKGRLSNMKKARDAKLLKIRRRSMDKGSSRAGSFAGASNATFLQPLPSDAPSGRLSPPPKVFDPSSLLRKRKRSGSLSPLREPRPKSELSPSPLFSSLQTGLIRKSWLKLGKML